MELWNLFTPHPWVSRRSRCGQDDIAAWGMAAKSAFTWLMSFFTWLSWTIKPSIPYKDLDFWTTASVYCIWFYFTPLDVFDMSGWDLWLSSIDLNYSFQKRKHCIIRMGLHTWAFGFVPDSVSPLPMLRGFTPNPSSWLSVLARRSKYAARPPQNVYE